jgi:CRISPR-associated endoribonuclease Cas6
MNLKIFEIRLNAILLKDIHKTEIQEKITSFIDEVLAKDEKMLLFHEEQKKYKLYSYGGLQPVEKKGVYSKGKIYQIKIRTVDPVLAKFFFSYLSEHQNQSIKGITTDIYILAQKKLERIYTLTPIIVKTEHGYWRDCLSFEEYEQRLRINLIKKYQQFTGKKIKEDFDFYTSIQMDNKKPVAVNYKNIRLLGDKLTMYIADDEMSQQMAHFALGVGLGENTSRGFGMLNGYYFK